MAFIAPQLASPGEKLNWDFGPWVMEEKYDGHRLIVQVEPGRSNLLTNAKKVTAWSRNGKPFNAASKGLPTHLEEQLGMLPVGIYDGEVLVPGERSFGVTELQNGDRLSFVAFDILEAEGARCTDFDLRSRRRLLELIFAHPVVEACKNLSLAEQRPCPDQTALNDWRDEIWARDGEGLILKRLSSRYVPGKRPKDWIKVKQLRSAVLRVTGWLASKGKINDRGKYAIAVLCDGEGHETTVKVRDDATIAALETEATRTGKAPFVGRYLRIDYQERTPDGLYRHPRWDRWEDE